MLAAVMIGYAFIALWAAGLVPAADFSPVSSQAFDQVFNQSRWIIVGSITAFLLAQLIDVTVFWLIRRRTGQRLLWLRATGSTIISQLIDTYVVGFIGLYLPYALNVGGGVPFNTFIEAQTAGYGFKLLVAIAVTPLLYVVHAIIDRYLGTREAHQLIETTAQAEHADSYES
jgi:hypothetical protein